MSEEWTGLPPDGGVLEPQDLEALEAFRQGSEWLRAVACTLARRGAAFRAAHPERARALLDALASSPVYKGGQFLFDLLEWEDFMLDGPPPPFLESALDARALSRIAAFLRQLQGHLDGRVDGGALALQDLSPGTGDGSGPASPEAEPPPPLEASFYLYADVVLGVLQSAQRLKPETPEG